MSEVRGSSGARGNPPPRRALSRVRPLEAEDGPGSALDTTAAAPSDTSPAAAPGGTEGRDLLIPAHPVIPGQPKARGNQPGKAQGRAKNGRPVPSLADLMPPAAPSGRRHGEGHAGHHKAAQRAAKAAQQKAAQHKADHGSASGKGGKSSELSVHLSKPVRKALKARAAELGLSPEDTVAQLVEVWLEG